MFVLARAVTYSALFIGLLLVFLPGRILASTGIMRTCGYRCLASCRDASGGLRRSTRAHVYPHVCVRRQGDSGTVRSASSARGAGPISTHPESDVCRCRPGLGRCRALLSIDSAARLCWFVPAITHLFVVLYEEPHCGELSLEIMRRTVGGSVGGGRNSERYPDSGAAEQRLDPTAAAGRAEPIRR